MPKIKSNRSAMKRFRVTAKGKIKRGRGFRRHLLSAKAKKRKRRLRKPAAVSPQELKNIRKLVPYL